MSRIKVLVVEDDPLYALDLKILMKELDYELVGVADTAEDVFSILKELNPDLVLMDIKLKGKMNGIEVAEKLSEENNVAIIFITSYDDPKLYEKAKRTPHFGYLVKPINKFTLESAIEIAMIAIKDDEDEINEYGDDEHTWDENTILDNCVFIKKNSKLEKVDISDIIFIQSDGNYCVISTAQKKYALKMSLVKVKRILEAYPFARVNKRHIINMSLITSIDLSSNQININEVNFSIGRTYKDKLLRRLKTLS